MGVPEHFLLLSSSKNLTRQSRPFLVSVFRLNGVSRGLKAANQLSKTNRSRIQLN